MKYFIFLSLLVGFFYISNQVQAQAKSSFSITKEQAVQIAKHQGYYKVGDNWQAPLVTLDSAKKIWLITCTSNKHVKRGPCYPEKCRCEETNGCTEQKKINIQINAMNGKVIRKMKRTKRLPNYE